MTKYRVTWEAKVFCSDVVDVPDGMEDDYSDPMNLSFMHGYPDICAKCSGWHQGYVLDFPDDPAQWEFVDAEEVPDDAA